MTFPFGIKDLDKLYRNSESGNGGFFPLGKGVLWHSGIHINSETAEEFSPLLNGKVVMYRLSKDYKTVDLPKTISKNKFDDNEAYYGDLYKRSDKNKDEYTLKETQAKEYVSDCFVMLKHELYTDALNPSTFIFYTLYMNLEPALESGLYENTHFQVGEKIHLLSDEESFFTRIIGRPGLDKGHRYFDYVLILDKDLRSYSPVKSKPKYLFLGIKSGTTLYGGQLSTPLQSIPSEELLIPIHTHFEVDECSKGEKDFARLISLKTFRICLLKDGGLQGEKIEPGKNYTVNNCAQIWFGNGQSIDFSKEKTSLEKSQQYLYDMLKDDVQSLKGTSVTVVSVTNEGRPAINFAVKKEKKFWAIDNGYFSQNDGIVKQDKTVTAYSKNPYSYIFAYIPVSDELRKSITCVESDIYKSSNNTNYYKAMNDYSYFFIDEETKNECLKSCFDWDEWFFSYEPSDENSIRSENTSLTRQLIEWYETKRKKYGWPTIELNHWWGLEPHLKWKFLKLLYDGKKDVQAAEQMLIVYRKCICKHPIEWDASVIGKLHDAKQDKKTDLKTIRTEHIDYLESVAKVTDIWKGGLSKIFTTNSLFFANPLYFINHLEKAGLFEFNPYKDLTYEGVKVKDNSGFAPYLGENKGISGYVQMTWEFNAISGKTWHAGIDFAVGASNCGRIPIHSLIQGNVIANIDYGNKGFGNCIVVQSNLNATHYYIVAHMSRDKPSLKEGDDVYPGKIVGYVGNTGTQITAWYRTEDGEEKQREMQPINESDRQYGYGAHLHVQFLIYDGKLIENNSIIVKVNPISYNPINHSIKWKGAK